MESDKNTKQLLGALLGFASACIALALLYFCVVVAMDLFDVSRARFRVPIVVFVLPILGVVYGWKAGDILIDDILKAWFAYSWVRALIILPSLWVILALSFISLFEPEPFSRGLSRMSASDVDLLIKILVFPLFLAACGIGATYLIRGKK